MSDYGRISSRSWNAPVFSRHECGTSLRRSGRVRTRCGNYYGASSAWASSSRWRTIISMPGRSLSNWRSAAQSLAEQSHDSKITAAVFRDRIGTGRKLAIQILEFFDRTGMTIREGDLRRLREDRLEILKGADG